MKTLQQQQQTGIIFFLISSASVSKERKQNIERKIEKLKEETHKDACYETFFVDSGALLLDFIQFLYVGSKSAMIIYALGFYCVIFLIPKILKKLSNS